MEKAASVEIGCRKRIKSLSRAFGACLSNTGPMEAENGRAAGLRQALSWHLEFGFYLADKEESGKVCAQQRDPQRCL